MGQDAGREIQSSQDVLLAQYQVVAARRQNFDSMVWQVPALALTAQAFLMTIALGPGTGHLARIAAGLLSALAALMSGQLLLRQRVHEGPTPGGFMTSSEGMAGKLSISTRPKG